VDRGQRRQGGGEIRTERWKVEEVANEEAAEEAAGGNIHMYR